MEAFSMLKFWRITAAESASDFAPDDDEDDSFFDLEFGLPFYPAAKQSSDSVDSPTKQCTKPLSPTSLLRSPPRFPVFMLFNKSKCQVKSEEEEEVRISSILQGIDEIPKRKYQKQNSISKKLGKDMVTRYAKLIKPLYVKVSRRYGGETVKISDEKTTRPTYTAVPPLCSPRKSAEEKQGPVPGLRVVCKQLIRKSLNGSSIPIPARRDDRLMEQHDGIQGAILHCKRSYNNSSSSSSSSSDYSWKKTILEEKRFSI